MTDDERAALVDRIRTKGAAARDEKGQAHWHALFHALSGRNTPTDTRSCALCELAESEAR